MMLVQCDVEEVKGSLSISKHSNQPFGRLKTRRLSDIEYEIAQTYILLNCYEVEPYIK